MTAITAWMPVKSGVLYRSTCRRAPLPDAVHTAEPEPLGPNVPAPEPSDVRVHEAPNVLAAEPENGSLTATPLVTAAANVVAFVTVLVTLAKFADFCATDTAPKMLRNPNWAGKNRFVKAVFKSDCHEYCVFVANAARPVSDIDPSGTYSLGEVIGIRQLLALLRTHT